MWFHVNSRRVLKKNPMQGSRHVKQSINPLLIRSYSDLPVSPFSPIRDIWISVVARRSLFALQIYRSSVFLPAATRRPTIVAASLRFVRDRLISECTALGTSWWDYRVSLSPRERFFQPEELMLGRKLGSSDFRSTLALRYQKEYKSQQRTFLSNVRSWNNRKNVWMSNNWKNKRVAIDFFANNVKSTDFSKNCDINVIGKLIS